MKVAIFSSSFYPHIGGVEEAVRQIAHELQRRGDLPLIVTNRWPKSLPAIEDYEGLKVYRYIFRVRGEALRQTIGWLLYARSTLNNICANLQNYKPALIHVQCVSSNAYYALHVKKRLKLPLVLTLQGELLMDANRLFQRSELARSGLRTMLREADIITACSAHSLEEAQKFYGRPFDKRACVIPNGVSLTDFESAGDFQHPREYILAIGRLVVQKGFDVLIKAFARSNVTSYDLLIAGEGPEKNSLEQLSRELGLKKRIQFLGGADRQTVVALLKSCSFVVLPSRANEGLPLVSIEAMAAGKVIIASKVGGVPEAIIDGETGILVPPEDISALSDAIVGLHSNNDLKFRLGLSGHKRVQNFFTWDKITSQYSSAYEQACLGANHLF